MQAVTEELALRYLLELSTDIRAALLLDSEGKLLAAAPERPGAQSLERCAALVREVEALGSNDEEPIELDATVPGGAVFALRQDERTLICVTGPFALPGLILHDMRVVVDDLRRGAPKDVER
jgi:hypothetical protein